MAAGIMNDRMNQHSNLENLEYRKADQDKYYPSFKSNLPGFIVAHTSVAQVYLYIQANWRPLVQPLADIITVAKRDQNLFYDEFCGYTSYRLIENVKEARKLNLFAV